MPLSTQQRLDRLNVRIEELKYWREREILTLSGWTIDGQPIEVGQEWPDRHGVHTFAASAEVPDHWPLSESRLVLDLGGESLVTLSDPMGEGASFGVDPYHREFPIRHQRIAIIAESTAREPFGVPVRSPRLNRAELHWVDLPVHSFHLLMRQIAETCATLAGHDVVPHLLTAAENAQRSLDWPSESLNYISRMARSPQQQRIWQLPESIDQPSALNQSQRASVTAAHQELVVALKQLQVRYPPEGNLLLTGHAHIDLAWLWPYDETRRKMRRTFHTALSLMEQSNDYRFNQSTAQYYAQIEVDDPALFQRIKTQAGIGQWEVIGGMWVEPDTNMPTGESLARQILYGQRYFEKHFGKRHKVCWLPDCFGFSGALPQLLKQGGIDYFFTIKVNWSETNRIPSDLFWWEGIDGSRVLAHTFENPVGGYNGRLEPEALRATWTNFKSKTLHDTSLLALGYGDGGGGTTPEMVEREEQLRDFPVLPRARWGHVGDYFDGAHERSREVTLPTWRGEIYLELHRATLTTQSNVKRLHRQAERALITAETLAGLGHLLGAPPTSSLENHWRLVLKNEFHDILPGSSIREVYQDAEAELGSVIDAGKLAQSTALTAICGVMPNAEGDGLLVVNPSLSTRRVGSSALTIPPLSVAVVDRNLSPLAGLSASTRHLENELINVRLNEDGTIGSIIHKPTGREALAGPGNQLWAYPVDKPRNWDAWDLEEDYAERGEHVSRLTSFELEDRGPDTAAVTVVRAYRDSTITQTYLLVANSPRLDIETTLDWHDRRVLLRTLTPVAVRSEHAVFECANGVIKRPTHQNTSWDQAMYEAAAHRFIDLSEPGFGVTLLNNAKYGHNVSSNILGLSLVRSPIYPDPRADEGTQSFTYAIYPHAGEWHEGGVREEAEDLNQPLVTREVSGLSKGVHSPLSVRGIPVAISGLKPAEDGNGLVLRVYEPAGRRGHIAVQADGWTAEPVTIMEEPQDRQQPHEIMPFEVRSWRLLKSRGKA